MAHILKNTKCLVSLLAILLATLNLDASEPSHKANNSKKVEVVAKQTGIQPQAKSPLATLYKEAANWLKTPYQMGGMSKYGVDCSALTGSIYSKVFGIKLHRRSKDISSIDVKAIDKKDLKPGDLVFFATSRRSRGITHVGVYLGNNHFVHASTSKGVIISNLNESYYKRTWVKGGQVKELDRELFKAFERIPSELLKSKLLTHNVATIIETRATESIREIANMSSTIAPTIFLKK